MAVFRLQNNHSEFHTYTNKFRLLFCVEFYNAIHYITSTLQTTFYLLTLLHLYNKMLKFTSNSRGVLRKVGLLVLWKTAVKKYILTANKTTYLNLKKHRYFLFVVVFCSLQIAYPFQYKRYIITKRIKIVISLKNVVLFAYENWAIKIM